MPISKQALSLAKNKEKEQINSKKSKYQDYEADIMFLKKEGFSISRIAQFLEDTYNLKNDKSLTALQSFIKVREKRTNKADKQLVEKKAKDIEVTKEVETEKKSSFQEDAMEFFKSLKDN